MAKGYPDFYGFSIFPRYGAIMVDQQIALVVPNLATTTIHELTGKGRIAGGSFRIRWCTDWSLAWPIVTIDGNVLTHATGITSLLNTFGQGCEGFPVALKHYSGDGATVSFDYVKDYVFNNSYKVEFYNFSGLAGSVHSYLNYTLMQ